MSEEVFRKKSLDRVKSPDSLDDMIRVSNPGVWLLLISVIILLAGACVWGIFGRIDSAVQTSIRAENGTLVCYIAEDEISLVEAGMPVKADGIEAVIDTIGEKEERGYVCVLRSEQAVSDGSYEGKIITDSIRPLSFILN